MQLNCKNLPDPVMKLTKKLFITMNTKTRPSKKYNMGGKENAQGNGVGSDSEIIQQDVCRCLITDTSFHANHIKWNTTMIRNVYTAALTS